MKLIVCLLFIIEDAEKLLIRPPENKTKVFYYIFTSVLLFYVSIPFLYFFLLSIFPLTDIETLVFALMPLIISQFTIKLYTYLTININYGIYHPNINIKREKALLELISLFVLFGAYCVIFMLQIPQEQGYTARISLPFLGLSTVGMLFIVYLFIRVVLSKCSRI